MSLRSYLNVVVMCYDDPDCSRNDVFRYIVLQVLEHLYRNLIKAGFL